MFCFHNSLMLDDSGIYTLDVLEEHAVAVAEIVASLHTVESHTLQKSVLRASAETEVGHVAVEAHVGQAVEFVFAETPVGLHHVVERGAEDVADAVFGEHVAVAAVEVAVLLDDGTMATDGLVDAESSRAAGQVADGGFYRLHKLTAYVFLQPEVGDGAEESAVSLGRYGVRGEPPSPVTVDAWRLGNVSRFGIRLTLHHGQELHEIAVTA